MESYKLLGFIGILRESINMLYRNGKLMASMTILILLFHSLLFISNIISTKSLITDLLVNASYLLVTSPNDNSLEFANLLTSIKEDARILAGVEFTFFLAYLIVLLFSLTATIIASSITYCRKNFSVKDLLSRIVRSWIRLFVTWFYISLCGIGFTVLVWAILIPLQVIVKGPVLSIAASIVLVILALVFYTYDLAVVGILSIVISVIEEGCYGIEALGKAGRLVKGMRLHGFALNLFILLVSIAAVQGRRLISIQQSVAVQMIIGVLVVDFICLVKMFGMMAYTVFYYQCKKNHGEEIELQGNSEYVKLSNDSC